jgi:hypothetical protein
MLLIRASDFAFQIEPSEKRQALLRSRQFEQVERAFSSQIADV